MPFQRTLIVALLAVLALAAAATCTAQIPQKMNYQVMLTDDADQPLADQTVEMVFEIWDGGVSVVPLWTETQNVTTNSIGVVSVILGSVNPIDIDFDIPLWLEVEVDGEVLSPRREIVGAPYALTDEAGGAGDGHSLDAADGSPVNVVYVDGAGEVGVGTTAPEDLLHVNGNARVGSATTDGNLEVYSAGSPQATVALWSDYSSRGGALALWSNAGDNVFAAFPDDSAGGGGQLYVARNAAGDPALDVQGNSAGTQNPVVTIAGSSQEVIFDMTELGDASVQLPLGAVNSGEIFDEARVASSQHSGGISIATYPSMTTIRSSSIFCPDDGYVLALATGTVSTAHTYGSNSSASFGITNVYNTFSGAQVQTPAVLHNLPTGSYTEVINCHGLFPVTGSATNWFYFQAYEGYGQWTVWDYQLTLVYIPSSGGFVDTDPGWDKSGAVNPAEIAANRYPRGGDGAAPGMSGAEPDVAAEVANLRARLDELERRTEGRNQ